MKLYKLKIEGFRKLKDTEVTFGDATFLIGENNVGKSTVLAAIEKLLSGTSKVEKYDFSKWINNDGSQGEADTIVLTAEFRNVPEDIIIQRGFNSQRLIRYAVANDNDSGLAFVYRKTFKKKDDENKKEDLVKIEMQLYSQSIKNEYKDCKKPQDYIDLGLNEDLIKEKFGEENLNKLLTSQKNQSIMQTIPELWEINNDNVGWFENPGGIQSNVLSVLPKFILIPAEDSRKEIDTSSKTGAMVKILNELFSEVQNSSDNFQKAQSYLKKLELELDPNNKDEDFGKMMWEINNVIDEVFPRAKINATADLSELKPNFNVTLLSNIETPVEYQGTGMIRAAVFALLRYREKWNSRKDNNEFHRGNIICFEEPEIYLHPNATNKMRDTIYELAGNSSQIICTTHSPYMIDLSRKPRQVLDLFQLNNDEFSEAVPFNITDEFLTLSKENQSYIKMIQKIDDYVARVFFAKHIIVVEGDTEDVVLKRCIDVMPQECRNKVLADYQIIKARGKAAMVSLCKYLKAMQLDFYVMHDRDNGVEGAEKFNQPILDAVGNEHRIIMMEEEIEDELGYKAPTSEKPYTAYTKCMDWQVWNDIPEKFRNKITSLFDGYLN